MTTQIMTAEFKSSVFSTLSMYSPEMLANAVHMSDVQLMSMYLDMLELGYV
jgi:hypothetical protein